MANPLSNPSSMFRVLANIRSGLKCHIDYSVTKGSLEPCNTVGATEYKVGLYLTSSHGNNEKISNMKASSKGSSGWSLISVWSL